jgi:TctA family transporter
MMEENLRRAMTLSRGDPSIFFTRPISLGLLIAAAALLVMVFLPAIRKKREEAFVEEEEFQEFPHPGGVAGKYPVEVATEGRVAE